jgi:heme exporter protein D
MGGYAVYVWTAFGLTCLVLVGNLVSARLKLRQVTREIHGQIRREQRIQNR